mmetsp:Transcript_35512/g.65116  ORF Transcript_35512/g.65116 Transcript_35512/m.65116 type:complete len:250 (+) Transcript_35512:79-828(+)
MFLFLVNASLSMIFILVMALATCPNSSSFVHVSNSRRMSMIEAIASPLDQIKLDFVGSLDSAYDLNPTNSASASFLSRLVEQQNPETITREIVESFDQLGTGKWRIVYIHDYSTSLGFGSLFGDISAGEVELGNDGSITSNIECSNPSPYQLKVKGTFGTARNNMLIKVNNVQPKQLQSEIDDGLLSELKGLTVPITQTIIEKNWPKIFSGVVVVDLAFIDDNLAVFDLDFLARVKGRRICARKEPDFF